MIRSLLGSLLLLLFQVPVHAQWEWIHPQPAHYPIRSLAFTSDSHGYFYNSNGDLYETNDQGSSWQLKQAFPFTQLFELKNNTGLISGALREIFISRDAGQNWSSLPFRPEHQIRHLDIVDDSTYFLGSNNSILYRTTDGGTTWTSLNCNATIASMEFISADTGWVGLGQYEILYTTDGGVSWKKQAEVNVSPSNTRLIHFTKNRIGFAFREHSTLLRTEDYGSNWTGTRFDANVLGIQFINDTDGFVSCDYGKVYKTTDAGITWTSISPVPNFFGYYELGAIYFLNSQIGFVAGNKGRLLKTIDGGKTWQFFSSPYDYLSDLAVPSENTLYISSNKTIYKSGNGGKVWEPLAVDISSPIDDRGIIKTIHFFDVNNGFMTVDRPSRYYFTNDGGNTWTSRSFQEGGQETVVGMQVLADSLLFLHTNEGNRYNILKSTNKGNTWELVLNPMTYEENFNKSHFLNENEGFGVLYSFLYKTTDGGKSWNKIFPENEYQILQLEFPSDSIGYLSNSDRQLYKTNDGGQSWQSIQLSPSFHEDLIAIKFLNDSVGIVAAEDGTVFATSDGGQNWKRIHNEFFQFHGIKISPDNNFYLYGRDGLVAKYKPEPIHSQKHESSIDSNCLVSLKSEIYKKLEPGSMFFFELFDGNNIQNVFASGLEFTEEKTSISVIFGRQFIQPGITYRWRVKYQYDNKEEYGPYQYFTSPAFPIPPQLILPTETTLCPGDSILAQTTGTDIHTWFLNGQLIGSPEDKTLWIKQPGRYAVLAQNSCFQTDSVIVIITGISFAAKPVVTENNGTLFSSAMTGNQWLYNGIPIPGATGSSFKPDQNGYYQVFLKEGRCTSDTSDRYQFIATGESKILTFPNPVVSQLTVVNRQGGTMQLQLLDRMGQVLFQTTTASPTYQLDMSGYRSGTYFLNVYFPATNERTVKMILKL